MQELIDIISRLKAPKNQRNNFGNYNYRSCEDILEAVKPLCVEYGVLLTISDEVINVGDHNYVKATAWVNKDDCSVSSCGWAREPVSRKGMDDSQITGSASSYARKYALNGLFCIDDTKDADTQDNRTKPSRALPVQKVQEHFPEAVELASQQQVQKIQILIGEVAAGLDRSGRLKRMNSWLVNRFPGASAVGSTNELTKEQASAFIETLQKQKDGMNNGQ